MRYDFRYLLIFIRIRATSKYLMEPCIFGILDIEPSDEFWMNTPYEIHHMKEKLVKNVSHIKREGTVGKEWAGCKLWGKKMHSDHFEQSEWKSPSYGCTISLIPGLCWEDDACKLSEWETTPFRASVWGKYCIWNVIEVFARSGPPQDAEHGKMLEGHRAVFPPHRQYSYFHNQIWAMMFSGTALFS